MMESHDGCLAPSVSLQTGKKDFAVCLEMYVYHNWYGCKFEAFGALTQ